jgi:hypothetical protein
MADGSTKPIGHVQAGDKVASADPGTGKFVGPKTVTATLVKHDTDLADVTVRGEDGEKSTIHTTTNHPFYDATTHKWTPVGKLKPGHTLLTATNHRVSLLAVHLTFGAANRFNLTVSTLHTYYVVAGSTPVLVHNCDSSGVEEKAGGNTWTSDLSHVTGKTASSRNRAIDAIISEDFPDLQFAHQPVYSPWVSTGIASPGGGTQIGAESFVSRAELRDSLVHEELHHRWFGRGIPAGTHHPRDGSGLSPNFYGIVARYKSIRGWE